MGDGTIPIRHIPQAASDTSLGEIEIMRLKLRFSGHWILTRPRESGRSSTGRRHIFLLLILSWEPLFAIPCCNTSRATCSTPSEPPHKKPFFEVLWFSALVQAAVVNLFVLSLVCFISLWPCIPETGRLENRYSCGFWLWSWLAAVVNLFVCFEFVVLHFRLPIPETGRL